VTNSVRKTLLTLGAGVVLQRVLQLAGFVCIGRQLGVERLGVYAQGQALAALLAVLAGAGARNLFARAVAHDPGAARDLVLRAVRVRLGLGALLAAAAVTIATAGGDLPWFWTLCALQVLPAAFDLKHLLDATGRTRAEVGLETGAAALQLLLTLLWLAADSHDLAPLAGIALASRCVYALGAVPAIANLPHRVATATAPHGSAATGGILVSLGQTAHELMAAADVWLVAACFSDRAAGIYAVAVRLAGAALLPSTQLARLLLPHLLRAGRDGDPARTVTTAWRATLLATLPMWGGGIAVAAPLCRLPGAEFEAAGTTLVVVLLASCLQHLGWQCSHALLAGRRDRAFGIGLLAPACLHAVALFGVGRATRGVIDDSHQAPLFAGLVLLLAQGAYVQIGLRAVHRRLGVRPALPLVVPLVAAAATGGAATLPSLWLDGHALLPAQLAAGGAAYLVVVWWAELRGRWQRVGDGLCAASGFRG
jgi:O-antigen/teichoic acid export membrane protein